MTVIGEIVLMIATGMGAIKVMDVWDKRLAIKLRREEKKRQVRRRRYGHPHDVHHKPQPPQSEAGS